MAAVVVFWLSIGLVTYAYLGYPLIAWWIGRRRPRKAAHHAPTPRLSVIIAAHNEADVIWGKLESTLAQRYPPSRLEVIVVSDGSTDATDRIVAAWPDPRVRLIRQEPRAGKSLALNRGVAVATGEVLVFTDANALFAPDALRRLAAAFAEPLADGAASGARPVGLVSGQGLYGSSDPGDPRVVANGYLRYEAVLRAGEGALGFLAGADGAIYALRRPIYRDLAAREVNDLLHPIQAALAGYVCRFEPEAWTIEPPSNDSGQEFRRHVRMIAQGAHLLRRWLPALIAARRWRALWTLASHRLVRWTTGLWLMAALGTNLFLVDRGVVYLLALGAQVAFYAVALAGLGAERTGLRLGPLAFPYYFCVVAAAGLCGLSRFLRGGAEAVWAPAGGRSLAERPAA